MVNLGFSLVEKNYKTPYGAVNYKKIEKYGKIAEYYSLAHPNAEISFAVAEVVGDDINVIFDAF